jgi:hypothetical protein
MDAKRKRIVQELDALIYCGEHEIAATRYLETDRYKRVIEYVNCRQYAAWKEKAVVLLEPLLDAGNPYLKSVDRMAIYHFSNVKAIIALLSDIRGRITDGSMEVRADACPDHLILLRSLLDRFHRAVLNPRPYLGDVTDEICNEQKLLHTLLELCFDDIRTIERTPLYDGGTTSYFLLAPERITVELKVLREQSPVDCFEKDLATGIDYHRNRAECDRLLCLVYDPGATITDPRSVEDNFRLRHGGFVEVIVSAPERVE